MDWSKFLEEGESIRWEGRPAPRCYTFRHWRHSLFGVFLLVIATWWQMIGLQLSAVYDSLWLQWLPVPFWMVGAWVALYHVTHARLEWEHVFYAVTDRRLLVHRGVRKQTVSGLDLEKVTYFRIMPLGEHLGTVMVCAGSRDNALTLCCVEYPRKMTDLLEASMDLCSSPQTEGAGASAGSR